MSTEGDVGTHPRPLRALRIAHIVIEVSNLAASERFYTAHLGFEVVGRMAAPAMAFLTLGIQHHDLALIEREDMRSPPKKGLHHFALQVADLPTLRAMYAALLAAGVPIPRAVAHIATHSFYFNDPDGHLIELFCDVVEDGLALARSRPIRHMDEFLPIDLAAKSNA